MSLSLNTGFAARLALHQTERRLQLRWIETGGRDGNRAPGQEPFGNQDGAAIEFTKMPGIEQPRLEVAPEIFVRQNALAIDLVFHRRFLEAYAPADRAETL